MLFIYKPHLESICPYKEKFIKVKAIMIKLSDKEKFIKVKAIMIKLSDT